MTVEITRRSATVVVQDRRPISQTQQRNNTTSTVRSSTPVTVQDGSPIVEATPAPNTVQVGTRIGPRGSQGIQGPPGASEGGGVPPIAFSFGDASSIVWVPDVAGTITYSRLVVATTFDGAGAALSLGTVAAPGSILANTDIDPATAGEYEATADKHLDALEGVRFVITPGAGASQGAGLIYLTFLPD